MKLRFFRIWGIFLLGLLLLAQSAQAAKPPLRLGILRWEGFANAYFANEWRYWKAQGLEVELKIYNNIKDYVQALLHERADFYIYPIASLVDFPQMYALGVSIYRPTSFRIHLQEGLTGKDLKGKIIGLPGKESSAKFVLGSYLKDQGLSLADIRQVILGEDLSTNFTAGRLDGVLVWGKQALTMTHGKLVFPTGPLLLEYGILGYEKHRGNFTEGQLVALHKGIIQANLWMLEPANRYQVHKGMADLLKRPLASEEAAKLFEQMNVNPPKELLVLNTKGIETSFKLLREVFSKDGTLSGERMEQFTQARLIRNQALLKALK